MNSESEKKLQHHNVQWIVEPVLDAIDENALCSGTLVPVRVNGKWGYVNRCFDIVIEPRYDLALSFSEGLAAVLIEYKWEYINTSGDIVIEPQFDDIPGEFSEGLVRISRYDKEPGKHKEEGVFSTRCMFGYADRSGNVVIEPQYRRAENFTEGLAAVGTDEKCG